MEVGGEARVAGGLNSSLAQILICTGHKLSPIMR